jgi:hypothetical protein
LVFRPLTAVLFQRLQFFNPLAKPRSSLGQPIPPEGGVFHRPSRGDHVGD